MGFLSKAWKSIKNAGKSVLGNAISAIGTGFGTAIGGPIGGAIGGALGDAANDALGLTDSGSDATATAIGMSNADKAWSAEQAQINRDFQKSERLATQQFNIDMWNMNNNYNSPAEQLKRAQAAGINPNAVFSGGVQGSTSSAPVKSSPMSGATATHPGSIAGQLLTSDAVVKQLMAEAKLTEEKAEGQSVQNSWDKLSFDERIRQLKATTDNILSEKAFRDVDKDIKEKTYDWFSKQSEADLKIKSEQLNELRNKIILLGEQVETENIKQEGMQLDNQGKALDNSIKQGDLTLKELEVQASQIIGVPLGTPEFDVHFKLLSEGKWQELADASMVSYKSVTDTPRFLQQTAYRGIAKLKSIKDSIVNTAKRGYTYFTK